MSLRLPLLSERWDVTQTCSYCPKLCRPSCPVANVTGNDALSAWGIVSGLDRVARRREAPVTETLSPAFACTGCGRCEARCELATPVVETVRIARSEARSNSALPARVRASDEGRRTREQVMAERGAARFGSSAVAPTGTVLFAGCTRVATEPDSVDAAQRVVERVEGPVTVLADLCCGGPWLDAGEVQEFRYRAERLRERLSRASRVITLDPGCAVTMGSVAGGYGIASREMTPFERWLRERIETVPDGVLSDLGSVAVHDACRLGRGLGEYDAPRALIVRLTGRNAIELHERRENALCSGAGGALPIAEPWIAGAITDELAAMVRASGADHVVTGCPSARARLARAGLSAWTAVELCIKAFERAAP
jgi:Fe-S oxidoreductase